MQDLGRPPKRASDPSVRYNRIDGGPQPPEANLGARQQRGQTLPFQARKKIEPTESIPQSSVTNLVADLTGKQDTDEKGEPGGYLGLDNSGLAPISQLPVGSGGGQVAAGNHTHNATLPLSVMYIDGGLSVGAIASRLPIVDTYTILGVLIMVGTAPVGANIIVDVNKNGSTIFTSSGNRPTILDGANDSGALITPDITDLVFGDYLTFDIDQVGSGTAGSNLSICVAVRKAI